MFWFLFETSYGSTSDVFYFPSEDLVKLKHYLVKAPYLYINMCSNLRPEAEEDNVEREAKKS